MTLYELLLMLHVFSAIIWLGAGMTFTVLLIQARRASDSAKEASYHADIEKLAPVLFIPASLATFIFGLLSAIEGNWDFGQAWIIIGLAGWLLSFGIGILYFKPESERIAALAEQGDAGMAEAMTRSEAHDRGRQLRADDPLRRGGGDGAQADGRRPWDPDRVRGDPRAGRLCERSRAGWQRPRIPHRLQTSRASGVCVPRLDVRHTSLRLQSTSEEHRGEV